MQNLDFVINQVTRTLPLAWAPPSPRPSHSRQARRRAKGFGSLIICQARAQDSRRSPRCRDLRNQKMAYEKTIQSPEWHTKNNHRPRHQLVIRSGSARSSRSARPRSSPKNIPALSTGPSSAPGPFLHGGCSRCVCELRVYLRH